MNLTTAIAHSNNAYFEALGRRLGFEKVAYYAHQYGLGELAGYGIPGEQLEHLSRLKQSPPSWAASARCARSVKAFPLTPLQLGAMVSAIANGGTLYYPAASPQLPRKSQAFSRV